MIIQLYHSLIALSTKMKHHLIINIKKNGVSIMTARTNIYVDQGTDFSTSIELFDSVENSFNVTGKTFYGGVRKVYSTTKLFDFDIEIANTAPTNDITLTISADKTAEVTPGKYQYDIVMIDANNAKTKILEGLLFITPTITDTIMV
jgi:hypothetical protein